MTFLPVVERELRVAARRRSTFKIRGAVTLVAIVISGFLYLTNAAGMSPAHQAGALVFRALSGYTMILALLAGVFLASDCLSEERREGTLGFLFLTDLKGYDVVLGKFAAVALNAFYGVLAVLPVLSLCLLAGGVTGAEFWRMGLALINTLFFTVAASMWVSANCQSAARAVAASIVLLLALLAMGGIAATLQPESVQFGTALFLVGAISPLAAFGRAPEAGFMHAGGDFWISLWVSHLAGWGFLGLASWRLKLITEMDGGSGRWRRFLTGNILGGKSEREAALLDTNPVFWLMADSRRLRQVVWGVAVAGAITLIAVTFRHRDQIGILSIYLAWPFYFLLKMFFGIQACRFFSESRRSGAIELLCCTPVTMKTLLRGQWLALRRIFLWPVMVLIAAQLVCLASALPSFASIQNGIPVFNNWLFPLLPLYEMGRLVADFYALGWFGMWSALSAQKWSVATGRTIVYVLILPAIVYCIPTVLPDAVFMLYGWTKLQEDFRRRPMSGKEWR